MQFKSLLPLCLAALVSGQSLTSVLKANSAELSTLTSLVSAQPALLSALESAKDDITILAPTNAAFAAFLNTTAGAAAATKSDVVAALLEYHVLNGVFPASDFSYKPVFPHTLLTNSSYTNVTGGQYVEVAVEGLEVIVTSGLLMKSKVIVANIKFDGGIIHVIDKVLTIPESVSATATAAGLTSLVAALEEAMLVETVDTIKDVTVFAPTNQAFANLGPAAKNLTVAELTKILTLHVISGAVRFSTSFTDDGIIKVLGGYVRTTLRLGPSIYVDDAKITTSDVLVANGVVHIIAKVISPSYSFPGEPKPTRRARF